MHKSKRPESILKSNENSKFFSRVPLVSYPAHSSDSAHCKKYFRHVPKIQKDFWHAPKEWYSRGKKDTPATKELWGKIVFFKRTWLLLRERYPQFHFCPLVPLLRASKRGASLFSSSTGVEMGSRQSLNFSFSCDLCSKTDFFPTTSNFERLVRAVLCRHFM